MQLFPQNSCLFSFFRTVTFSLELSFQNSFFFGVKILQSSHFLRIGSSIYGTYFSEQLFFSEELFRIYLSKRELLFWSKYFCTGPAFSEKLHFGKMWYFRKAILLITYFFWGAVFLERLLFRKTLPFIAATFSEGLLFYNILFQKSYYFTVTVPFHIYTSYLFVSN